MSVVSQRSIALQWGYDMLGRVRVKALGRFYDGGLLREAQEAAATN
jgi:hypothetical protein